MALINPVNGQLVKEYDTLQTVELNKNEADIVAIEADIVAIEDEIGTPSKVGSILYRLGIIKDYVIEQGTVGKYTYIKYASGRLVQKYKTTYDTPCRTVYGALYYNNAVISGANFPIPFIDVPDLISSEIIMTQNVAQLKSQLRNDTNTNTYCGDFYIYTMVDSATNIKGILTNVFEGRWKT